MLQEIAGQKVWAMCEGEGPPRLFIHCSLALSDALRPLARLLPPAQDIFFDLPGHGRSGAWQGRDYHTDSFDIAAALLDNPTHVIGHSFGATVALRLAVERPDLVFRLTLIEPVMFAAAKGTPAYERRAEHWAPFIAAWEAGDLEAASALFLSFWGDDRPWSDLSPRKRQAIQSQIHLVPAAAPVLEEDEGNLLGRLDRIDCPVDLIEGGQSDPVIATILDALSQQMPQARRSRIDGAGHMVPISHPHEVAQAILGGGSAVQHIQKGVDAVEAD